MPAGAEDDRGAGLVRGLLPRLAWPLAFLAAAAALQLWQPVPWDADTAYHVAVSRLIGAHGILRSFPWTPFSWLADHYADKELGFHLLLLPLARLDWITASRILGAILGAALLTAVWLVLRAEKVRWAGLWTLAALLSSGYFAMRFALVRPHLLSVPLALVVAWAAARRRIALVGAASLLYPWCYVGWHLALGLAAAAEVAHLLAGRRPSWRPLAAAAAGLGAGLLLHPNFPAILDLSWLVSGQILLGTAWAAKAGFALGGEFRPFDAPGLPLHAGAPLLFALAAAILAWRRRREDPAPLAFALAALGFGALTLATQRFIEYLAPFSAVAVAVAARPLPRPRLLAGAAAAATLAFTGLLGRGPVAMMGRRALDFPPEVEAALRERVPRGAQVFTCGWSTTGEMMLALPERRFMVALDPVLFHRADPERYRLWFELVRRPPPHPAPLVREFFGARYALCESRFPDYFPFLRAMLADPGARRLLESPLWVLFEIPGP